MHFAAMVTAFVIIFAVRSLVRYARQLREDGHSPTLRVVVTEWVKYLLRRDTDDDPDPDPDPDDDPNGDDDDPDDDCDCGSCGWCQRRERAAPFAASDPTIRRLPPVARGGVRPIVPPAEPQRPEPTQLDVWISASLDQGTQHGRIVSEGMRIFRVSESTMKRRIRRVRDGQDVRP